MKRLSIILPTIACIMVQTMTLSGMDPALTKRRQEARSLQLITSQANRNNLLRRKEIWEERAAGLTNRKGQLERQMQDIISTINVLNREQADLERQRIRSRNLEEQYQLTLRISELEASQKILTNQIGATSDGIRTIDRNITQTKAALEINKRTLEINASEMEQIQELLLGKPVIPRPRLIPARAEEIEVVLPPIRPVRIKPAQPLPVPIEPVVVRPLRPLPPTPEVRRRPYRPLPIPPARQAEAERQKQEAARLEEEAAVRRPVAAPKTLLEQIRAGRRLRPVEVAAPEEKRLTPEQLRIIARRRALAGEEEPLSREEIEFKRLLKEQEQEEAVVARPPTPPVLLEQIRAGIPLRAAQIKAEQQQKQQQELERQQELDWEMQAKRMSIDKLETSLRQMPLSGEFDRKFKVFKRVLAEKQEALGPMQPQEEWE